MEVLDRSKVKQYFIGKSQFGPIVLIIAGVITLAFAIGIFLLIGGVIWYLVNKFGADLAGEADVDKALATEIEMVKNNALNKANIISDQIENVEPVIVYGRGFEPVSPTSKAIAETGNYASILKRSMVKNSDDPVYMSRIGSDGKLRYSLVRVTMFMFGEKQLYIYYANVDLTTGLVYSEGTHEYFYTDINAVSFEQDREKVFNLKTKKYERRLFEKIVVYSSGCSYSASLSTDINRSVIESEFTGMRNLIRDRKNAN